uniref:Uncharacterized protein n=1 Tax=Pavo cristatus TaxID=9049 RepID=A0A8C9EY40_PAVCR
SGKPTVLPPLFQNQQHSFYLGNEGAMQQFTAALSDLRSKAAIRGNQMPSSSTLAGRWGLTTNSTLQRHPVFANHV